MSPSDMIQTTNAVLSKGVHLHDVLIANVYYLYRIILVMKIEDVHYHFNFT